MAEEQTRSPMEDYSEQTRIRLAKLQALAQAGMSPYRLTRYGQTHLSRDILGKYEALAGQ